MRSGLAWPFPLPVRMDWATLEPDSEKFSDKMAAYGVIRPDEWRRSGPNPPMAKSLT